MKKRIFFIIVSIIVLTSCNSNDSDSEEIIGEIKADYLIDSKIPPEIDGFVVNNDNTAYVAGGGGVFANIHKINKDGEITLLKTFPDLRFFYNRLTNNIKNEILLTTNNSEIGNKIYNFTENYKNVGTFYTMKPIQTENSNQANLNSICNYGDDTYIIFDSSTLSIKRIIPSSNTEILIAGSGTKEIKDGIGVEASFIDASQIIIKNNIIYVIDKGYKYGIGSSIRKIEETAVGWKVSTLISSTNYSQYLNIAIDSQNNFYVLISQEGISKLNLENNKLSVYKDSEIEIGANKILTSINFKYLHFIGIKNNDLYLQGGAYFLKISDFQSKI